MNEVQWKNTGKVVAKRVTSSQLSFTFTQKLITDQTSRLDWEKETQSTL